MTELYVYYKLRAENAAAARAAFEAARGDTAVRLLQREDGGELLTWMEIHAPQQADVEARVAAAMAPFIEGARHRELFSPLSG